MAQPSKDSKNNNQQHQQSTNMDSHNQRQNMNNNMNNIQQQSQPTQTTHYVSSASNDIQSIYHQQQQMIMKQNEKLKEINDHDKPSNGQHDRLQCIKHGGSTDSGKNIKSCLKYLLDRNKLGSKDIAERLEEEYKYSCVVCEDFKLKLAHFDIGGIECKISTWLISSEHQEFTSRQTIARFQILIIYAQKDNMNTADVNKDNQNDDIKTNQQQKDINKYNHGQNMHHNLNILGQHLQNAVISSAANINKCQPKHMCNSLIPKIDANHNDTIKIKQHNKPSMSQHRLGECLSHEGTKESKEIIRSCLGDLVISDSNQLKGAKVAGRLETVYNYSSIVYEDVMNLHSESVLVVYGGIEHKGMSNWLIRNKDGDVIARFGIFIIYEQMRDMKSGQQI